MKKQLMITLLTVATMTAQAQDKDHRTAAERAAQRTQHMTRELGLTPEQVAQVEAINLKYAELAGTRRAEREADRAEARQDGKEAREAFQAELKQVLTEDQFALWTAKVEERKKHREGRPKRGAPQSR